MKRRMGFLVCLFFVAMAMIPLSSAADEEPGMVVGRIFYVEGDLLRYVPAEDDWVAVVKDAPFGKEDTLFSGSQGMAELIVPNGAWIRIGNSTQIQFIALDKDLAEMDVASGVARFYNKSPDTVIKVTSPFGYVLADPETVFDFYVGDNSVEVVGVKGTVSFVHSAGDAEYDVAAGSPSILADEQQVSSGDGTVDADWDQWNMTREGFWAAKARVRGRSVEYLPPRLQYDSSVLDENGRWEKVYYEGSERWFWRPTTVVAGWSPFTVGRWTDWYGDQTWIPAEPFGYMTHHYGNWILAGNRWYWAPPVVSVRAGLPLLDVGFYWYPGRVSWIHSGAYVGWVPLAPNETYYSHRPWGGRHAVVVNNVNITRININVRNYTYINRAVVVNQNNFYNVNNYTKVRVTNVNRTTIENNYRAAPVVNNTVINNYTTIRQRYNYTDRTVKEKPHNTVINRIQKNQTVIRESKAEKATVLQQRVKSIPKGTVARETRIQPPKITNHIVPAGEVNRPKSEIKLQQREIKTRVKPKEQEKAGAGPGQAAPTKPGEPEKPAAKPERVAPPKPAEQEKPVTKPGRVVPPRPAEREKPAGQPERVVPPKPAEQEKPVTKPGRVVPPRPAEREKPVARPERVAPPKPAEQEKPVTKPGRVVPPGPSEREKPVARPERIIPPKSGEQERPVARPERVVPPKPSGPEKPAAKPERIIPPKPGEQEKVVPKSERKVLPKPSEKEKSGGRNEPEKPGEHEKPR